MHELIKIRKSFSLAETLIAMLVIGLLSLLTLPSLFQTYQESVTVTRVKKIYSELSQAFHLAIFKYGTADTWVPGGGYGYINNAGVSTWYNYITPAASNLISLNNIVEGMSLLEDCGVNSGCPSVDTYSSLDGTEDQARFNSNQYRGGVILNNGMFLEITNNTTHCTSTQSGIENVCGTIWVDVNGHKSPNKYGVDAFSFYYTKTGIVPFGANNGDLSIWCNKNATYINNGQSCAAWVLDRGNMEYLNKTVSWN